MIEMKSSWDIFSARCGFARRLQTDHRCSASCSSDEVNALIVVIVMPDIVKILISPPPKGRVIREGNEMRDEPYHLTSLPVLLQPRFALEFILDIHELIIVSHAPSDCEFERSVLHEPSIPLVLKIIDAIKGALAILLGDDDRVTIKIRRGEAAAL